MKYLAPLLCLLCLVTGIKAQDSYTFITYNIGRDNPQNGENNWHNRKADIASFIDFYEPDVVGIQEGLQNQVAGLDGKLKEYSYVGVGSEDGNIKGEYMAIFYRQDDLEVVSSGTFWLSTTPKEANIGWDGSHHRICTYAQFKNKESGKEFWVFNTQFDAEGKQAREKSVDMVYREMYKLTRNEAPMILMGDMNQTPETPPMRKLAAILRDCYTESEEPLFGPKSTAYGFDVTNKKGSRVDYIFVNDKIKTVQQYAVLAHWNDGRLLSDHFPVYVEVRF